MSGEQPVATLFGKVGLDATALEQGVGKSKTSLQGLAGEFAKTVGVTLGVGAALNSVKNFMALGAAEAADYEMQTAKVNAAILSTGGVAGVTTAMVQGLGQEMQNMTAFTDDAILSASALMLTFTQVSKDVFPDAIKAAADMTALMGGDMQSAVIMIGKALNVTAGDTAQASMAMSAMKRVGVAFTEDQVELAKTLIETGDTMGYQKLILKELNTEFGGQAAAQLDTYTGKVEHLKNMWADLAETVMTSSVQSGKGIIDYLDGAIVSANQLVQIVQAANAASTGKEIAWWERLLPPVAGIHQLVNTTKGLNTLLDDTSIHAMSVANTMEIVSARDDMVTDSIARLIPQVSALGLEWGLDGKLGAGLADYKEKMGSLNLEHDELAAELERVQKYYPGWTSKITELTGALEDNKDQQQDARDEITKTTNAMIYQALSADKDTQTQLAMARALGLLSEEDYAVASSLEVLSEKFGGTADFASNYADTIQYLRDHNQPITQDVITNYYQNHYSSGSSEDGGAHYNNQGDWYAMAEGGNTLDKAGIIEVGEMGKEWIINGVVIPADQVAKLEALGMKPKKKMAIGGKLAMLDGEQYTNPTYYAHIVTQYNNAQAETATTTTSTQPTTTQVTQPTTTTIPTVYEIQETATKAVAPVITGALTDMGQQAEQAKNEQAAQAAKAAADAAAQLQMLAGIRAELSKMNQTLPKSISSEVQRLVS